MSTLGIDPPLKVGETVRLDQFIDAQFDGIHIILTVPVTGTQIRLSAMATAHLFWLNRRIQDAFPEAFAVNPEDVERFEHAQRVPLRTADEHIEWAIRRALEYVDDGRLDTALTSMCSDLAKHPETAQHPRITLAGWMLLQGHLTTAEDVRRFILGHRR